MFQFIESLVFSGMEEVDPDQVRQSSRRNYSDRGPSPVMRDQDFACGLKRPQNGSSSIPTMSTKFSAR
jgi:hypothetical protein